MALHDGVTLVSRSKLTRPFVNWIEGFRWHAVVGDLGLLFRPDGLVECWLPQDTTSNALIRFVHGGRQWSYEVVRAGRGRADLVRLASRLQRAAVSGTPVR